MAARESDSWRPVKLYFNTRQTDLKNRNRIKGHDGTRNYDDEQPILSIFN